MTSGDTYKSLNAVGDGHTPHESYLGRCVRVVGHRPYLTPDNILKPESLTALTNVFSPPRFASLVTAVPYVVRVRPPDRNRARCVSPVSLYLFPIVDAKALVSTSFKASLPEFTPNWPD